VDEFSVVFGPFFSLNPIANVLRNGGEDRAQLSRLALEIGRRLKSIKFGKPELFETDSGFAGFAKRQFDLVEEVSAASGFVGFRQVVGYGAAARTSCRQTVSLGMLVKRRGHATLMPVLNASARRCNASVLARAGVGIVIAAFRSKHNADRLSEQIVCEVRSASQ
jgi:hypothetical protein